MRGHVQFVGVAQYILARWQNEMNFINNFKLFKGTDITLVPYDV